MHSSSFYRAEHWNATLATSHLFSSSFLAYLRGVMKECFHQECDLPGRVPLGLIILILLGKFTYLIIRFSRNSFILKFDKIMG